MPIASSDARLAPRGREETRQRILEAATAVFSCCGFERATMKEVAARCGLTDAAIYYYFNSKQELLEAALTQRWRLPPVSVPAMGAAPPASWEAIASTVDRLLDVLAANEAAVTLLSQEAFAVPLARDAIWRRADAARDALRDLFGHRLAAADAHTLADSVVFLVTGAVHLARARRDPPLPDALRDPAFRARLHDLVRVCAPLERFRSLPAAT